MKNNYFKNTSSTKKDCRNPFLKSFQLSNLAVFFRKSFVAPHLQQFSRPTIPASSQVSSSPRVVIVEPNVDYLFFVLNGRHRRVPRRPTVGQLGHSLTVNSTHHAAVGGAAAARTEIVPKFFKVQKLFPARTSTKPERKAFFLASCTPTGVSNLVFGLVLAATSASTVAVSGWK